MRLFVSYSHKQFDWVHRDLIPVLRAAGGEVLVDVDHFAAGQAVIGQMDALQATADRHVLVVTADHLTSPYCRHEMDRAIALDPSFAAGIVLPIRMDATPLPPALAGTGGLGTGPIYVDLRDGGDAEAWGLLLKSCGLALPGTDAAAWLAALNRADRHLSRSESVNLVVRNGDVDWRRWLAQLCQTRVAKLVAVDLDNPRAVPRNGLIAEILKATGRSHAKVPAPPDDLPLLGEALDGGHRSYLALTHFDRVRDRDHYGEDLFSSLRWAVMDAQRLVLLAHTRVPIADLLPPSNDMSAIDFKTVELG